MHQFSVCGLMLLGCVYLTGSQDASVKVGTVYCYEQNVRLACDLGGVLDIIYVIKNTEVCRNEQYIPEECYLLVLEQVLISSCVGEKTCKVDLNPSNCPWGEANVRIAHTCIVAQIGRGAIQVPCSQRSVDLRCTTDNHVLDVLFVASKRRACREATDSKPRSTPLEVCRLPDAEKTLDEQCDGQHQCSLTLRLGTADMPCDPIDSPVRIDYACEQVIQTISCTQENLRLQCDRPSDGLGIIYVVQQTSECTTFTAQDYIQSQCFITQLEVELVTSCTGLQRCEVPIRANCPELLQLEDTTMRLAYTCNNVALGKMAALEPCNQDNPDQTQTKLKCANPDHVISVTSVFEHSHSCRYTDRSGCYKDETKKSVGEVCIGKNDCEVNVGSACEGVLSAVIKVSYTCDDPDPEITRQERPNESSNTASIVVGVLIAILLLGVVIFAVVYYIRKRRAAQ